MKQAKRRDSLFAFISCGLYMEHIKRQLVYISPGCGNLAPSFAGKKYELIFCHHKTLVNNTPGIFFIGNEHFDNLKEHSKTSMMDDTSSDSDANRQIII
jgi:hypothetical protein